MFKDLEDKFTKFSKKVAKYAGKPIVSVIAFLLIICWGATGPIFGYSDTWQLIINTSTTIITFLMVFIIQNSQNRDGLAIQAKLDELIKATEGARNVMERSEDLDEKDIERLRD